MSTATNSTFTDTVDFVALLGAASQLLPSNKNVLSITRDIEVIFTDRSKIMLADLVAGLFEKSNRVTSFTLDCEKLYSSDADAIHSTSFDLSSVSEIDVFCVAQFLQFESDFSATIAEMNRVASEQSLLIALLPAFEFNESRELNEYWLFSRQNLSEIFGESLLSVEKLGCSWVVVSYLPKKVCTAFVWNAHEQRRLDISKTVADTFFESNVLDSLGIKFATDKSSRKHDYLIKYDFFLSKLRHERMNVVELGVFCGSSLKMWREYFPNAQIIGADIDPVCMQFESERIRIHIADLSRVDEVKTLLEYKPRILIDDASHTWRDQILAMSIIFPSLEPGSVYILEDLETSFSEAVKHLPNAADFVNFDIDAVSFIERINRVVISGLASEDLGLDLDGISLTQVVNDKGKSQCQHQKFQ